MNQLSLSSPRLNVYLSSSSVNEELSMRLKHDLKANGFTVWMAEDILQVGQPWFEQIHRAIQASDAVLLIEGSSGHSSEYSSAEFGFTLMYHRPAALLSVQEPKEMRLSFLQWQPEKFITKHIAGYQEGGVYNEILTSLLQALNALGAYLERERVATFNIRVTETPLTAQNLNSIISALTELSTKYWLIAKERFADLIEYTQTRNSRFAEEANVVVTRVSYNSPFNMDWKVDISAPSVAEALVTTIDGIAQRQERLEKAKLENQAKVLEISRIKQQAEHEEQMALLEQEQRRLEIEKQRLEILEHQLEVQKKGIEYALEIAGKVVDLLHPGTDPATRAMEIQTLLPNLVQLQNGKGLELALPPSQSEQLTMPKEE